MYFDEKVCFLKKKSVNLSIKLFEENLDAPLYYKIISQILLPFMVEKYDLDCYLHQDNDRKHTARLNQKLL